MSKDKSDTPRMDAELLAVKLLNIPCGGGGVNTMTYYGLFCQAADKIRSLAGELADAKKESEKFLDDSNNNWQRAEDYKRKCEQAEQQLAVAKEELELTDKQLVDAMSRINKLSGGKDRLAKLHQDYNQFEQRLAEAEKVFREWRIAHYSEQATRGNLPAAQITILADIDTKKFKAAIAEKK